MTFNFLLEIPSRFSLPREPNFTFDIDQTAIKPWNLLFGTFQSSVKSLRTLIAFMFSTSEVATSLSYQIMPSHKLSNTKCFLEKHPRSIFLCQSFLDCQTCKWLINQLKHAATATLSQVSELISIGLKKSFQSGKSWIYFKESHGQSIRRNRTIWFQVNSGLLPNNFGWNHWAY